MPACQSGRHEAKRGTEWENWEQMAEWEPCVPNINNRQRRDGWARPCVCVCECVHVLVCVCVPLSHCLWEFLSFTNRLFFLFFFYFFFAHTLSPLPFTVKFSDLHAHLKQNIVRAKKKTLSERPEEGFRYSNVLTFYSFMLAKQICLQCSAKNFKTNIKHLHGSMPNGWES